jgi:hypothetical protein
VPRRAVRLPPKRSQGLTNLSRATGLPCSPDLTAVEALLAAMKAIVQPEYRGAGMPFGPEVAVGDDAPVLDRFVAFSGRDPRWAP